MSNNIIFRMAAWTDAAGKYDPNAPLEGNEDNYYADDDLSDDFPCHVVADEDIVLSNCGMLMAVADGMGGMNAGEVASQIAHETVAEYFAPGKITPDIAATHESRSRYMETVIRDADDRIKSDAHHNSDHEGMGSTLIMAWIVGNELSLTWIGDSRAYRFNPNAGIELLTKDHTYVQELVDKGIISYEQTFDHPQNNIVTRSLGDKNQKARPESRLFYIYDRDIILLCSDGLSGVLRDCKTYDENGELYPEENIEDIIRDHSSSLKECREALWKAAEHAGWYDNVTAILCEIRSGAGEYVPNNIPSKNRFHIKPLFVLGIIIVITGGFFLHNKSKTKQPVHIQVDSFKNDTITTDTLFLNSQDSVSVEIDSIETSVQSSTPLTSSKKIILNGQTMKNTGKDTSKIVTDSLTPIPQK